MESSGDADGGEVRKRIMNGVKQECRRGKSEKENNDWSVAGMRRGEE